MTDSALAKALNTGSALALCEYLECKLRENGADLERAPLAKVRHIQGKVEALRELLDVARTVSGAAHPARR